MNKKVLESVKILDVRINSTSITKVLRDIRSKLNSKKKFYIVTPNPEQVMKAQEDEVFKKILNSADIAVPDGIGLVAAQKFLYLPTSSSYLLRPILYFAQGSGVGFSIFFDRKWLETDLKVIRGRDLFLELIKLANKKGWKVFLLGDQNMSAQKAVGTLSKNYKHLKAFAITGPNLDLDANPESQRDVKVEKEAIDEINRINPELLFIGFGAPRQEKWLYRHYAEINFGGAMVVGGTFDYISGEKKIPPKWVSDAGLEWLWRLLFSNQKKERIIKAFPQFPLKIFLQKISQTY